MLAAAAAPGHADELAGEQMAVAAFEANHLASVADSRSEQMIKSPLAKILTVKVIAAAFAVGGGGVALAASTGTFSASSSPASIPQTAAGLCTALAKNVAGTTGSLTKTAEEQALANGAVSGVLKNNTEFSSLVSTAQSVLNVPDYCALLLQLPGLPQPADLVNLPVSLLSSLLTQLPVATLAQDLTSLPGSVVTQLFQALPTSTVTQVLNELPTSAVSQLVTELPSSLLSGLSGLSGSVLGLLPGR